MQFHMVVFKKIRDHPHQKRDARKKYERRHWESSFPACQLVHGDGVQQPAGTWRISNWESGDTGPTGCVFAIPFVSLYLASSGALCPILGSPVQER